MSRFRDPEPLDADHDIEDFDCGVESLNVWLKKHAPTAAAAGSARTYVMHGAEQDRVVGFHALAAASIDHAEATRRAAKGMPRHPIPAVLLARLAVDTTVQGRGIGAWLLRDAMLRSLSAAESVGIRVLLVHAIDDVARAFYEHHGFEMSPTDPLTLQMLINDIRAAVEETAFLTNAWTRVVLSSTAASKPHDNGKLATRTQNRLGHVAQSVAQKARLSAGTLHVRVC